MSGFGQQLYGGAEQPASVPVADDRAVHLGQLAQPLGGELHVEREPAAGDALDGLVQPEDDEAAGTTAQDALQAVAEHGAGGDLGDCGAQPLLSVGRRRLVGGRHWHSSSLT